MEYINCKRREIIMRRILYSFLILLILSACSQEKYIDDTENEILLTTQDVVIPSIIFTSEKQNSIIGEDEIKLSIKTYLDSDEELSNASEPFQEIINEDKKLNKKELEKFDKINKLSKENDKNFSNYILNNTLPEGFQEESERISQYIIGLNEILSNLDETLSEIGEMLGDVDKKVFEK
ncbi:NDxxF motif lipoprotein [Micromonospora provocatoris]